jgi:hypothetical protein
MGQRFTHLLPQVVLTSFARKNLVRFFQSFLRADVEPDARHAPDVNRRARVKPLNQQPRLIRIVAFRYVLPDQLQRPLRIIVQGDARDRALWFFRFFLKKGDPAVGVGFDRVVLLNFLQIADIVHAQNRRVARSAKFAEPFEGLTEKIVAGDDDNVIIDAGLPDHQVHVADRAQLVRIIGGVIIDRSDRQPRVARFVLIRPLFKMAGELLVRDDVDVIDFLDRLQTIKHVLNHRLAGNRQQGLRLIECQRVEPRRVAGGQNN